ncbi:MAG: 30S ribosomal protein S6 [Planctomycetota bacterium]
MRLYEATWICKSTKGKPEDLPVVDELKAVIEKAGAEIVNLEKWDERKLAYPIRDNNRKLHSRGLYCVSHFNAPSEAIKKIQRDARLLDSVLRVLIITDEDGPAIPDPYTDADRKRDEDEKRKRREERRGSRGPRDSFDGDHDRGHGRDRGDSGLDIADSVPMGDGKDE